MLVATTSLRNSWAWQWRYDPVPEKAWRSRTAACSLLKLLLCRTRRRAPRDLLIEALWPDVSVSNASHNLDTALSVLRTLLRVRGKASLLTTVHSHSMTLYQLPPQAVLWVDVDAFQARVALAEQTQSGAGFPQKNQVRTAESSLKIGGFLSRQVVPLYNKRKTHTSNTEQRWAMDERAWGVVGGESK